MTVVSALRKIVEDKKSNLVLSLDLSDPREFLNKARLLGPKIAILKSHIDIIDLKDFTPFLKELKKIAHEENFLLFEDRKFADIGATVEKQFTKGPYQIASWADIINAHPLPGPGMIEALKRAASGRCALLLVAEMSAAFSYRDPSYQAYVEQLAKEHADFVIGFIAQKKVASGFIHMSPGISLDRTQDSLGQRFRTPKEAIQEGADFIIVGRSIYEAKDPLEEAERYRQESWQFFENYGYV